MGLATNSKDSLYGGVNQQSAEHRLPTQVEESINAIPTVNSGLLKRNPTKILPLDDTIAYDVDMWVYGYDRGLAGDNEEKYSVHISSGGMFVVDTITGEVFKEVNGRLVFENQQAKDYVYPFGGFIGYSAVTIKDTTFLLNKNTQPKMLFKSFSGVNTSSEVKHVRTIDLKQFVVPDNVASEREGRTYAPYSVKKYLYKRLTDGVYYDRWFYEIKGSTTKITIDGHSTSYKIDVAYDPRLRDGLSFQPIQQRETFLDWLENIKTRISEMLPANQYHVESLSGDNIRIVKYDGTDISMTFSIDMDTTPFRTLPSDYIITSTATYNALQSNYYNGTASSTSTQTVINSNISYENQGYVWIKSANPSSAYSYKVTVKDELGNSVTASESSTTTTLAAGLLASTINANANFTAEVEGSVIKITSVNSKMVSVETSDSFGNQASFGWSKVVNNYMELPKKLGFDGAIVHIDGDISSAFKGYWLEYIKGAWKETVAPNVDTVPDKYTMPHILVRNFDVNGNKRFVLKQWDGWVNQESGDRDSNPLPSFMEDNNTIKDIFFFKNRLGFITQRSVILSEVGNYGNFFRTTTTTVLDSDRIDTVVDTTKAIQLEYVTYLEDNLMLFSDKAQFKLEGGAILSPKSIQVSQTSAYEINKNVRPLFMNDKVFFCAKRGNYTAVMQYHIFGDGRISEAVDITAHVDKYIPSDVISLSGSSINNMLFINTRELLDTVFVYKYLDDNNTRVQSAWFKWQYNGEVHNVFSLGKNLNILINRYPALTELNDSQNFEIQEIHPQEHTDYFMDASQFITDTSVIENITSTLASAPLVYDCNIQRIYPSVIAIDNTDILTYSITAFTSLGETYTSTNESLLITRNPLDYIVNVAVTVNDVAPVIFTGIHFTYEEQLHELIGNGLFQNGTTGWSFTDWIVNYGEKDTGAIIPVRVDLGEWVFKANSLSQTQGTLKFKTCQINSETDSDFELEIKDVNRNSIRTVKRRYTVNRKPMIYGDAKNVRLSIVNNSIDGFRINSVSLEGNYNSRNKRTS